MKQNLLKTWLMLVCLIVGVGTTWATDVVYKTAKFGTQATSGTSSSYTTTYTSVTSGFSVSVANGNTNGSAWNCVKFGRKGSASVGSITTSDAIDKAITKVVLTIDAITATNVNSIKLYTGATADACTTEVGTFSSATGDQTVNISSAAANKFYKISIDCKSGSGNGFVAVSKVAYYYDDAAGGDSGDGDSEETITINMASLTNPNTTSTITYGTYNWTSGTVSGVYNGASSSNNTSFQFNYSSSGSSNYRDKQALYNTVAIPGKITSIKMVTASGSTRTWTPYVSSSAITPANYTSATALTAKSVNLGEGTTWAVTGNNSYFYLNYTTGSVSYIGDIVITYTTAGDPDPEKTLIGIEATGTPAEFWKGDAFNHNGITVTATWDDETETDVTSSCSFSGYDMSTPGQQTVTVTYEGETCQYGIEVKTIANTQATAYTVAQAKALIDAGKDLTTEVYVKGTISSLGASKDGQGYSDTYKSMTYWLDDDAFEVYSGKNLGNTDFTSNEDLAIGDQVVVYGVIKKFSSTYELDKNNYIVSLSRKTITALAVSGTPAKTTYNAGEAFDPAGLTVTATYSDESTAEITTGFDWEIDYGTGNEALVAGATSVDVMVYTEGQEVMSEVYTVNGLTVTVPVTLTSIAVSGTPAKTEYYAGDAFETAGLVVTGTYSDSHQETITEGIEWTANPETLTLGTTSVDVKASVGEVNSEVFTVNDLTVTENPYKTATISSFSETSGDISTGISYEAFQGKASTAPAVYDNSLRLYQNGGYVTVTAVTGLKIASVKITTSGTYNSTTVGYCVDNENAPTTGETVAKESSYTINGLNNKSVSIYCLGTDKNTRLEISAMEVTYSGTPVVELSSIALSGTYPTEFTKGDEFSHEGMTVTANYTDGSDNDVTSEATFSGYDMNTIGEQTVTVSYTENEITKIAQYTINVKKAPFVPTPAAEGYEVVDFTTIEPYKSLATNGSADMTTYEGTSFSAEFAKKSGTNNAPKYYENGNAVRAYIYNTITIKGAAAITGVHMGWAEGYVDDAVSITGLGTTTAVVTFSKTCRFTDITVYYNTLTLNEGSTTVESIENVPYGVVTVNRALKAEKWNTFCVPFDMSSAEIKASFGTNASVKALDDSYLYVSGLNFGINFVDATSIKAGVPYMVMIDGEEKASFTVYGAKVNTTALNDVTVTNGGNSLTFQGNYTSMKAPDASFIISNNTFYYVDSDVTVNGFRGYITTESAQGGNVRALSFGFGEGITTGISTNLSAEQQNARIYNLQGMQQSKLSKGVNIVNGKKVIR